MLWGSLAPHHGTLAFTHLSRAPAYIQLGLFWDLRIFLVEHIALVVRIEVVLINQMRDGGHKCLRFAAKQLAHQRRVLEHSRPQYAHICVVFLKQVFSAFGVLFPDFANNERWVDDHHVEAVHQLRGEVHVSGICRLELGVSWDVEVVEDKSTIVFPYTVVLQRSEKEG